jgi:hypothetical protein
MTADLDEIRDADRLIALDGTEEGGLIGFEISPTGFIAHLAPCRVIR